MWNLRSSQNLAAMLSLARRHLPIDEATNFLSLDAHQARTCAIANANTGDMDL
jgi:hypothetical protein